MPRTPPRKGKLLANVVCASFVVACLNYSDVPLRLADIDYRNMNGFDSTIETYLSSIHFGHFATAMLAFSLCVELVTQFEELRAVASGVFKHL
ncbi:hypothetical protein OKW38_007259 [Paraburkholderia sp. MM5496-R1]